MIEVMENNAQKDLSQSGEEKNKRRYLFVAVVLFLMLVSGLIGYVIGRETGVTKNQVTIHFAQQTLHPSPTQKSQIDTSSWRTYQGDSFQFKYPSTWEIGTEQIMGFPGVYNPASKYKGGNGGGATLYSQTVPIFTFGQSTETVKQYVDSEQSSYLTPSNPLKRDWSRKTVIVNGLSSEVYTTGGEGYGGAYLVLGNGKTLVVFGPLDSYPTPDKTVNTIIASFKFSR